MAANLTFGLLLSVVDKATRPLASVRSAFAAAAKAGESLQQLSQSMHDSRENVQDFADRGRAALESLVAPAAEIEQALLELRPVAAMAGGDAAATLRDVRAAAEEYSKSHAASASEYVAASTVMLRANQDEAAALQGTAAAMRLASATTTEAKAAAQSLNVLYEVAGDKTADWGSELGRLSDVLTRTRQIYGDSFNVAELADPLKDASAATRDAKVPVEQLVGALGALAAAGIKGGEGGAAVANVITGLQAGAKPLGIELVKTAQGGLDLVGSLQAITAKYGDLKSASPQALAAMQEAFGPAWRDVSALLGQTGKLSAQWGSIGSAAGAAAAGQAAAEATMSGQMAKLDNQLNAVKATLGTSIMNAVSVLAPELLKIVKPIADFAGAHPKLAAIAGTVAVLAVGAANIVAPLLSAASAVVGFGASALGAAGGIGVVTAACWAWVAALLANPITWIVVGVVAAVALIIKYWKPITAFFVKLWADIKAAFVSAWNYVVGLWNKLTGWFVGLFIDIRDTFKESFVKGLWKVFTLLSPLGWMIRIFGAIQPWLAGLWARCTAAVWNGLKSVFGKVVGVFTSIWQGIKDAFGQGILQGLFHLWQMFSPVAWVARAFNALMQYLFGISLSEVGAKILNSLLNGLASVGGAIVGFVQNLGQTLWGSITAVGETLWSGISNDLARVWEVLTSFSLVEAGAKIVSTLVEGIKSVAGAPAEAVRDVVQRVRNYLPFSPAKEGPLRDLNRVRLVETVAEAVNPSPLVHAMRGAAGAAFDAVRSMPAPTVTANVATDTGGAFSQVGTDFSPVLELLQDLAQPLLGKLRSVLLPERSAALPVPAFAGAAASVPSPVMAPIPQVVGPASSRSTAESLSMQVTIQLGGATGRSAVEELEAWIRDPSNARALAGAVKAHQAREKRTELT